MRLDIAVSIDIVLPAREQRDPIEELERERRIAAFGDKATDEVRDLDMLERIVGALGDNLIFDQQVNQCVPVAVGHFGGRQDTNAADQRIPQSIDLLRSMLVDVLQNGAAPSHDLYHTTN